MRIIEEPKKFTNFEELKHGDVFSYDGVWYMKIETIRNEKSEFNAVDLQTGTLNYIATYSYIVYQDAELRVNEL